jgi:hypothetical protein
VPREIVIDIPSVKIELTLDGGSGTIKSNLHYADFDEYCADHQADRASIQTHIDFGHVEGCIDGLESLILALACAGYDVESDQFKQALETTLDAIGNNE